MKEYVFGVEKGYGDEVVSWINEQADSTGLKLKVKLTGYILSTPSFGDFELFLLSDESLPVRKLILSGTSITINEIVIMRNSMNGWYGVFLLLFLKKVMVKTLKAVVSCTCQILMILHHHRYFQKILKY